MAAPRVWIGYPVEVSSPAGFADTFYAIYKLAESGWESVRTTHVLGVRSVRLTALHPLEFERANPHAPLSPTRLDPLGDAAIILVAWEGGILEGPFEITSHSVSGASPVVTLEGEVAARFDDDILEFIPVPQNPDTSPWIDLLQVNPWQKWRVIDGLDVVDLMRSQATAATTAALLRQALEEWGVTVVPTILAPDHRPLRGGERILPGHVASPEGRYFSYDVGVQYVSTYPTRTPTTTDLARPRSHALLETALARWRESDGGLFINAGENYPSGYVLSEADGLDEEQEVSVPDYFNGLGDFRERRIVIEQEDVLGGGRILLSDGASTTRAVYLDRSVLNQSGLAPVVWDRTRWELQNTAAITRLALYWENPIFIPNQIITVQGLEDLGGIQWRVTQAAHSFSGSDGVTELDLAAWQGPFESRSSGGGDAGTTE